jgi:hypothetical protein
MRGVPTDLDTSIACFQAKMERCPTCDSHLLHHVIYFGHLFRASITYSFEVLDLELPRMRIDGILYARSLNYDSR